MPNSPTQPMPATESPQVAQVEPNETADTETVFGFVLLGGPLSGALVRDVRLANELADRGWPVHAWWMMDRPLESPLRPQVQEHWLFHGFRYLRPAGSNVTEAVGRFMSRTYGDKKRARTAQKRPGLLDRMMQGLVQRVCMSVEGDRRALQRFARDLSEAGVTHLLPMLGIICPWAAAARALVPQRLRYLVTFQGYELYVHYARAIGCEQQVYERLRETAAASDWPAIAVSDDYRLRVIEDIGVPAEALRAIPPGIPDEFPCDRAGASNLIAARWPEFRKELPLVTFVGRRDTEKGIDLLLYAVTILRKRGVDLQLAVVGPTLFGDHYSQVCQQLAEDLRCPVMWSNKVVDELRSALFAHSRCIVYPSIHREPFGMVAVEALAHRTPAVVPDHGGIAAAIEANDDLGGLRFRSWDSGHLAEQIERLLTDDDLHRQLSDAGPRVAEYYSVRNLADRVLAHLGLPATPPTAPTA